MVLAGKEDIAEVKDDIADIGAAMATKHDLAQVFSSRRKQGSASELPAMGAARPRRLAETTSSQKYSHIRPSRSEAATAANATRNAVTRSLIMISKR
jgi:hypothetical protein